MILYRRRRCYSSNHVTDEDGIVLEFIKAVFGHKKIAGKHDRLHAAQGFAHEAASDTRPASESKGRSITPPRRSEPLVSVAPAPALRTARVARLKGWEASGRQQG